MKYLSLISFFLLFSACSGLQKVSSSGEEYEISKPLNQFLNRFEQATVYHNKTQLVELLDLSYKKKRYEALKTKEDKDHFFRVFYCGKEVKTHQTICPAYNEVVYMEFIGIEQIESGNYKVKYLVHTSLEDIVGEWIVTVSQKEDIEVLGVHPSFYSP